jgi:hypothetical protein
MKYIFMHPKGIEEGGGSHVRSAKRALVPWRITYHPVLEREIIFNGVFSAFMQENKHRTWENTLAVWREICRCVILHCPEKGHVHAVGQEMKGVVMTRS